MIGVGVAGCGYWGSKVILSLEATPGLRVVAASDPKEGRRAYVERNHPGMAVISGFEALLEMEEVEAIWLATPVGTHAPFAREALARGRHVLVEKPMATRADEAAALVELADRKGVELHVGHTYLHSPAVAELRRLLADGAHGRTCYIASERINPGPPATEVSVLWDLAVHDVAILLDLIDQTPITVSATAGRWRHSDLAEMVMLTLQMEGDVSAQVHVSWMSALKTRVMKIFGTVATLVYDDLADPPIRWIGAAADNRRDAGDAAAVHLAYGPGETREFRPAGPQPLLAECAAFRDAMASGRRAPNEGRRAVRVVEVLEAAEISLASAGARVALEETRPAAMGGGR
ncbi:MAG TPA: Gfo/Idh/MocA family oxidoreductase [Candidatus Polarisedimenticolia bacterium]|jgi:predicted dehydrogenase